MASGVRPPHWPLSLPLIRPPGNRLIFPRALCMLARHEHVGSVARPYDRVGAMQTRASRARVLSPCTRRVELPPGARYSSRNTPSTNRYKSHRFPAEIISHALWLSFRSCRSYREAEELLFARGIIR
jgi:hypothetical protein